MPDFYDGLHLSPLQTAVLAQDGTIRFVNRAWNEFAAANEYRGPDFTGLNYFDFCEDVVGAEMGGAARFARGLRQVVQGALHRFDMVYPCHSRTGKHWFKAIASRTDHEAVVSHVDISREIKQARDSVGLLASAEVVHELRSPLNGILGFAELGMDELATVAIEDNTRLRDCFQHIHKAGCRLRDVVDEVLQHAPKEPDLAAAADERVDLATLAMEVCGQLSPLAGKANIALSVDVAPDAVLYGEQTKLWKILANLVSNAVKYNRPGGHVWIEGRCNAARGIELTVSDDGVGIAADMQARIFEPFTRSTGQPAVTAREGTGLGLAVVRALIEAHDGSVGVVSREGEATTFTVHFPTWRTAMPRDNACAPLPV